MRVRFVRLALKVQKLKENDSHNAAVKHRVKSIPFFAHEGNEQAKDRLSQHEHDPFAIAVDDEINIQRDRSAARG